MAENNIVLREQIDKKRREQEELRSLVDQSIRFEQNMDIENRKELISIGRMIDALGPEDIKLKSLIESKQEMIFEMRKSRAAFIEEIKNERDRSMKRIDADIDDILIKIKRNENE